MVIERPVSKVSAVRQRAVTQASPPVTYKVLIRIDDSSVAEKIALMVEKAFGSDADMECRPGGKLSGRMWLEVGPYPREIAEARAEVVRRSAMLGRIDVGIRIKKAA
jgi:hypothetical protein